MTRYLRLWPWAVALIATLGYGCEQRKAGALGARVEQLTKERDALAKRGVEIRKEFVHDTVVLTKRVLTYRTLVDSIRSTDTLTVREQIIVASADTAIKACQDVVRSCAKSLAIADSLRVIDQRTIKLLSRAKPSFVRQWSQRLLWGSVGYTIARVTR